MNLTIQHFAGFVVLAAIASAIFKGAQLYRAIGWIALWQLFTPVRPAAVDIPLMAAGWFAAEMLYVYACRVINVPKEWKK